MNDDIFVRLADMPCHIKAFSRENEDCSHTIILNSHQSYEQQLLSYSHELKHILNDDFSAHCSIDQIEHSAHYE